ncbi:MAG: hypothetical protein ACR652_20620 [Methylocystis sp.]|uniref:hypothetical protein n=1 Tax=Methylocystis sp. TaxID=1911079 RepID=UPI003DA63376
MAHVDLHFGANARRRPSAAPRGPLAPLRDKPQPQGAANQRPEFCRIDAGQVIRALCLLLLCLGCSFLPRGEKLPAQGAVVEAAQLKL